MSRDATFKLTGTNTLLMSNGRMADPHDKHALEYAMHMLKKPNTRTKAYKEDPTVSYDWLKEEERIQYFGLMYWDPSIGFHFPSDNILYMIRESYFGYGSTSKGGDRLLSILTTDKEAYPITFSGPEDPQERFNQRLFRTSTVTNKALGGAKVRVLQPMFKDWTITFTVSWAKEGLERDFLGKGKNFSHTSLHQRLIIQGHTFGMGAYRKSGNYGNFEVELLPRAERPSTVL